MTTNYIGNTTTIIKYFCTAIAGYVIGICIAKGLNLPINESQLSEIIFTIIMLGVGYLDSKYPNTFKFLGNNEIIDVDPALEYPDIQTEDNMSEEQ